MGWKPSENFGVVQLFIFNLSLQKYPLGSVFYREMSMAELQLIKSGDQTLEIIRSDDLMLGISERM